MLLRPLIACGLALTLGFAPPQDQADLALDAARSALEKGAVDEALVHLERVLVMRPLDAEALGLALQATSSSPDSRGLWSLDAYNRLVDERGKLSAKGELGEALRGEPWLQDLGQARLTALKELERRIAQEEKNLGKRAGALVRRDWYAALGRLLVRDVASLEGRLQGSFAPQADPWSAPHKKAIKALERVTNAALSSGDLDAAIRGAIILRGIARQAGLKDLKGPAAPNLESLEDKAQALLARARERLGQREEGQPLTVEQLESMTNEEAELFTAHHSSPGNPGLAVSPTGKYLIETWCGYETLLGVATTVEAHHERLASWYGKDPFEGRQGLVRVVPEAAGLEGEGTPFWWAGGFQSGDLTVLRFTTGTIEGFGHGLTHELTHRFDGALCPWQPAWMTEGKAVWTGGAFGSSWDESFVPNWARFGTMEEALVLGYGAQKRLEKLIDGTIEDYRDNYVAGFALYVYLNSWNPGGEPLYRERLREFQSTRVRDKRPAVEAFEAHFADGGEGRPAGMEAFAKAFDDFISGFYWLDPKPFLKHYTQEVPGPESSPYVYDAPTWGFSRNRAEPFFGQDHARRAAEFLLSLGKREEALDAFAWSRMVDEPDPRLDLEVAQLYDEAGDKDAAWILRASAEHMLLGLHNDSLGPAPFAKDLPKLGALLAQLDGAAQLASAAGSQALAAALRADHAALANFVGQPVVLDAEFQRSPVRHPFDGLEHRIGNWSEPELTGYDKHRVPGLWYIEPRGAVHVGREKPREGSGNMDARASRRHIYVQADPYLDAGRYRLRTRVHFTTSYATGAVVLGYRRRDRNVRLRFTAGDYMFSIGQKQEQAEMSSVHWSLDGLFERENALSSSRPSGGVEFENPTDSFDLELIVDHAACHAYIDGKRVGSYHDPSGRPIEGYVGFAMERGAIKLDPPRITRLDRSARYAPLLGDDHIPEGLDLSRARVLPLRHLRNRKVRGLRPAPQGTLLVWGSLPLYSEEEPFDAEDLISKIARRMVGVKRMVESERLTQPVVLAVPAVLDSASLRAALEEQIPELLPRLELVRFGPESLPATSPVDLMDEGRVGLLFVDSAGVLRHSQVLFGGERRSADGMRHWLDVFRGMTPEDELPPVDPMDLEEREGEQ